MELPRPKLFDALHGYNRAKFLADLAAGVTVGVVALPLAIGFGIASGSRRRKGLWTAIIAGFLISALGGSMVQIGGPTGAFVPILAGIVATHGYSGLALATMMAGIFARGDGRVDGSGRSSNSSRIPSSPDSRAGSRSSFSSDSSRSSSACK